MSDFNLDVLRDLENMSLADAQSVSIDIIESSKTKKAVMNRLIYDIKRAPTAREVMRIMWATYMSGTGFGIVGSKWKSHYRSV